jgi:hypothetical protein
MKDSIKILRLRRLHITAALRFGGALSAVGALSLAGGLAPSAAFAQAPAPDTTNPVISLNTPADDSFARSLAAPSGTVSDEGGSGVQRVSVAIFRQVDQKWFNGTDFQDTIIELPATVTGNTWAYNGPLPSATQLPDSAFVVISFAFDNAGNLGRDQSVVNIDRTAPTNLAFTQPRDNSVVSNLALITGTVADNGGASNIESVQISIRRLSDGLYFDGTDFVTTPVRLDAQQGGGFFSLGTPLRPGALLPDGSYSLTAFARDRAGNETSTSRTVQVIGDVLAPTLRFTTPTDGAAFRAFPALRGTVTDFGGTRVERVEVGILRLGQTAALNTWFNGRSFQRAFTTVPATLVGGQWSLTTPLPSGSTLVDGQYVAIAYGFDTVGNRGEEDISFFIDRVSPVPPQITNPVNGRVVTTLSPLLAIVRDAPIPRSTTGTGIAGLDFFIRRDADGLFWNGSSFVSAAVALPAFAVTPNLFRRDGGPAGTNLRPGFYSVLARARDRAGNQSQMASRVRVRDAIAPRVSIFTPVNNVLRRSFGIIEGSVIENDPGSGLAQVLVSIRRVSDGFVWNGSQFVANGAGLAASVSGTTFRLTNTPPESALSAGQYTVEVVATDREGNRSNTARVNVPINPDRTAPTLTVTDPLPNAVLRELTRVSGTVAENQGGVGLNRVVVAIQRGSDRLFWNGRGFSDTFTPIRATVTGNTFSLTTNLPPQSQTPNGFYSVIVQAFDNFGNFSERTVVFQINNTPPAAPATNAERSIRTS